MKKNKGLFYFSFKTFTTKQLIILCSIHVLQIHWKYCNLINFSALRKQPSSCEHTNQPINTASSRMLECGMYSVHWGGCFCSPLPRRKAAWMMGFFTPFAAFRWLMLGFWRTLGTFVRLRAVDLFPRVLSKPVVNKVCCRGFICHNTSDDEKAKAFSLDSTPFPLFRPLNLGFVRR